MSGPPAPGRVCLYCNRKNDDHTQMQGKEYDPQDGDVAICFYCAGINVFGRGWVQETHR